MDKEYSEDVIEDGKVEEKPSSYNIERGLYIIRRLEKSSKSKIILL